MGTLTYQLPDRSPYNNKNDHTSVTPAFDHCAVNPFHRYRHGVLNLWWRGLGLRGSRRPSLARHEFTS